MGKQQSEQSKPFAVSKAEVWEAWLAVAGNRGAAGVDGVEIDRFEQDLQDNLYKVWNRMASGSYFPAPVRAVDIPKPGGAGVRTLGVPTVADRVAQRVAAARIEAVVEPKFHPDSYGFRPGRSAHDAVEQCRERCWHRKWAIDLDIAKFFDEVDWERLILAVESLELPRWVALYVRRWLAVDAVGPDGVARSRDRGLPQGGPASPVLANLFLHWAFDVWIAREHPTVAFERYADDAIVHCVSRFQAEQVLASIDARMGEVGLRLHPDKTRIVYCGTDRAEDWEGERGFTFLGFDFRRRKARRDGAMVTLFAPGVSKAALKRMSQQMRSWQIARWTSRSFADLAQWINPIVAGWMHYYGRFRPRELYPLLAQLNTMLLKWVCRKHRRYRFWKRAHRRWEQVVEEYPTYFTHWRWVTWYRY